MTSWARESLSVQVIRMVLWLSCAATSSSSNEALAEPDRETDFWADEGPASAEASFEELPPLPEEPAKPAVRPNWGFNVEVPLWLDVDREVVRPGAGLDFWVSADLGYFVIGARSGVSWTPIDLKSSGAPELDRADREPLRRVHFSPEIRLQIPFRRVLPYLSSTFDANWWSFRSTSAECDGWYCNSPSGYEFTPGYTGRSGLGIHATEILYIDFGLAWMFTAEGDFFNRSFWTLAPYAGILFRR